VVHDTSRGGEDNETELTGGEEVSHPLFNVVLLDVEAWGDDTALVDTADQLDDDLAGTVVIDDFEFTNVT
jgi:hypothetical protein